MSATARSTDAGFTLVEMLVVIALLALIVVALGGGLRFGARVWETTNFIATNEERTEFGAGLVRELLSGAEPVMRGSYVEFDGHRSMLSFETTALPAMESPGLAHVTLSFDENGMLVVKLSSAREPAIVRTALVPTGLRTPRFSYLDTSDGRETWLALWRDRDHLPSAVRIDQDSADREGGWPLLIIQLPIAQVADCQFDPVSLNCRESR